MQMAEGIINLTEATFDETVKSADKPILVDFWATWCGPCKQMNPILEQLSSEMADRIIIAKVDADECPSLAQRFGVMHIPHFSLLRDGEVVHVVKGAHPKHRFVAELEPFLPASR